MCEHRIQPFYSHSRLLICTTCEWIITRLAPDGTPSWDSTQLRNGAGSGIKATGCLPGKVNAGRAESSMHTLEAPLVPGNEAQICRVGAFQGLYLLGSAAGRAQPPIRQARGFGERSRELHLDLCCGDLWNHDCGV